MYQLLFAAVQVTGALNMFVRMTSDLETYIVSAERIKEYIDCPKEVWVSQTGVHLGVHTGAVLASLVAHSSVIKARSVISILDVRNLTRFC